MPAPVTPGAALTAAFCVIPTAACAAEARGMVGICAAAGQGMLKSGAAMFPGRPLGIVGCMGLGMPAIAENWDGLELIMVERYAIIVGSMPAGACGAELAPD